ncbi:MAG: efflux RND transporter periplasmic adaptor subunit [Planctomycetota bacterium]
MRNGSMMVAACFCLALASSSAFADSARDYQGVVEPVRVAVIRAEVSGQLLVDQMALEGQRLEPGQPIARQDDREQAEMLKLAVLEAKDQLPIQRAAETIKELELRYAQAEELVSRDAGARWELRQAQVQLDLAEIDLAIAHRDREAAALRQKVEATRLARYTLRAPFAGRIMKFEAQGGASVAGGDPVAVFAALDKLRVEIYLPLERYGQMRVDQTYQLAAEAPVNRRLPARLDWIDPMIDPASQTFRCVFKIDNPDEALPAGFRVWLPNDGTEAIAQPDPSPAPRTADTPARRAPRS